MSFPSVILPLFLLLLRCSTTFATGPGDDQYQYDFWGDLECPTDGYTEITTVAECEAISDMDAQSEVNLLQFDDTNAPGGCIANNVGIFIWNINPGLEASNSHDFISPVCKKGKLRFIRILRVLGWLSGVKFCIRVLLLQYSRRALLAVSL